MYVYRSPDTITDPWGPTWALITLSPVLTLAVYMAVIVLRREMTYVNVLLGQILCETVNGKLKRRIRQERPTQVLGSGYGMPSSHAQFCGFFAVFWTLHLLFHAPRTTVGGARTYVARVVDRTMMIGLVWALALLTCYSRYVAAHSRSHYLLYHTGAQIYVGASLGAMIGALYYLATERFLRTEPANSLVGRLRRTFYLSRVSRALGLRDTWSVWPEGAEDALYTQWFTAFARSGSNVAPKQITMRAPATPVLDGSHTAHLSMMLEALVQADHCKGVKTAFSVGCVIAVLGASVEAPGVALSDVDVLEPCLLFTGYSRELPGNTHAEECALEKLVRYCERTPAARNEEAVAAAPSKAPIQLVLYTTMEPCSERLSGNTPCVDRILHFNAHPPVTTAKWLERVHMGRLGFNAVSCLDDTTLRPVQIVLVVQGVSEPDDFVQCQGQRKLREANLHVITAQPRGSPRSLGLNMPKIQSIPYRAPASHATNWLEEMCLGIAKKEHEEEEYLQGI